MIHGLPVETFASDRELFRILRRCGALWSSAIAGGEGEAALLAGQAGLPFIGADYAANRAVCDAAGSARLYALSDPLAIADALHEVEQWIAAGRAVEQRPQPSRPVRVREIGFLLDRRLVA